jgi:histidinol-phosphate/aromatic aminotransferase/cobyric acid decarboxylase-like protein
VKLDVMESPTGCRRLAAEVGRSCPKVAMNRYPVPTAHELRALIREVMQVPGAATCCSATARTSASSTSRRESRAKARW